VGQIRLRFLLAAPIAFAVLLGGCGQAVNDSDVPAASGIPSGAGIQPGITQQSGDTQQSDPTRGPETPCEGGPLGCAEFTSVRGTDVTGDVAWLGTDPLTVSSRHANGAWTLFVHTPCNYLQVAVSVQDDVLTQLWMMVTDHGCVAPTDNYQAWTEELFEQPVQWKLDGDTLTLKNSHATIELKES